jgi:hypothetical protein
MHAPNTDIAIYIPPNGAPNPPDIVTRGALFPNWRVGSEESPGNVLFVRSYDFFWTDYVEVLPATDIRDTWPLIPGNFLYVPNAQGQQYLIVFAEAVRVFKGKDFIRAYLRRTSWGAEALEVKTANGAVDLLNITTLVINQAAGLTLSQPAAAQAQIAVLNQLSIDVDASGIKLKNDAATPGNSKYYGTDGTGTKGFFSLPASGMSNPMTTLGDIIYEDATPTPVRLAGNTSATRKFLSQTGNGSISAAPLWDTVSLTDLANIAAGSAPSALGGVPVAFSVSKTHTDFQAAAVNKDIEIFSAPAGFVLLGYKIKHSVVFTGGGGMASYVFAIGTASNPSFYGPAGGFSVFSAVSATNYYTQGQSAVNSTNAPSHTATTSIRAQATSNVNLSNSTGGGVQFWLWGICLP